jgi:quercetin dioxygenase-like cupin family protein
MPNYTNEASMQTLWPDANHSFHSEFRRIVVTSDDTEGHFSIVSWTLPPFWEGGLLHQHATHTEGCYVLVGLLAVTVGEQTHILRVGESAFVPQCTSHRLWNPSAAATTVLLIAMPGRSENELRAEEQPGSTLVDRGSA